MRGGACNLKNEPYATTGCSSQLIRPFRCVPDQMIRHSIYTYVPDRLARPFGCVPDHLIRHFAFVSDWLLSELMYQISVLYISDACASDQLLLVGFKRVKQHFRNTTPTTGYQATQLVCYSYTEVLLFYAVVISGKMLLRHF